MSDPTYCIDANITRLDPDAVNKLPAADQALADGEKFARLRGIAKDEIDMNLQSREPRIYPAQLSGTQKEPLRVVEVYGVLAQLNLDATVRGEQNDPYGTAYARWRERYQQQLANVRLDVDGVSFPNYQTCAVLRG